MLQKHIYFLYLLLFSAAIQAQAGRFSEKDKQDVPVADIYFGLGTGINNYSGLIGLEMEVPISPKFSLLGTAGLGGWGYKAGFGLQHYLNKPQFGSAFSIGYSNAFGVSGVDLELETGNAKSMRLFDAGTINLAYAYHFRIGQESKFVLGIGWAVATDSTPWEVLSPVGSTLNASEVAVLEILQPGGLLLSMKVLFGPS